MNSDRSPARGGFDLERRPRAGGGDPADVVRSRRRRRAIDVVGRPLPSLDEVQPVRRRRRTESDDRDRSNFASAFRNSWIAFWWNLWSVGRWCAFAAGVLFLAVGAMAGQPWGWVAAAVPLVVLVLWMVAVAAQGRRHTRGQAGPPPGWFGR